MSCIKIFSCALVVRKASVKLLIPAATLLTLFTLLTIGCAEGNNRPKALPSGKSCPENIAYLQWGVDKYFQALGEFPADVNQLTTTVKGAGPFVAGIPECPSGNRYVVKNGKVLEVP